MKSKDEQEYYRDLKNFQQRKGREQLSFYFGQDRDWKLQSLGVRIDCKRRVIILKSVNSSQVPSGWLEASVYMKIIKIPNINDYFLVIEEIFSENVLNNTFAYFFKKQ